MVPLDGPVVVLLPDVCVQDPRGREHAGARGTLEHVLHAVGRRLTVLGVIPLNVAFNL